MEARARWRLTVGVMSSASASVMLQSPFLRMNCSSSWADIDLWCLEGPEFLLSRFLAVGREEYEVGRLRSEKSMLVVIDDGESCCGRCLLEASVHWCVCWEWNFVAVCGAWSLWLAPRVIAVTWRGW